MNSHKNTKDTVKLEDKFLKKYQCTIAQSQIKRLHITRFPKYDNYSVVFII